jgi:hypothetical protein
MFQTCNNPLGIQIGDKQFVKFTHIVKVEVNRVFIENPAKFPYQPGFSYLPRPLNDKRFAGRPVFPSEKGLDKVPFYPHIIYYIRWITLFPGINVKIITFYR